MFLLALVAGPLSMGWVYGPFGDPPAVKSLRIVARWCIALSTAPHGVILEGGAERRRSKGRHAKQKGKHI